ncbi:trypsin-like peptidase domain-containing protein [bacterium]|nr:trypsin-like peptidase domain-containing protein [bacterium]
MALIPPFFPDCVVAIGIEDPSGGGRKWIASGFLYGHNIADNEGDTKSYSVYLITNRHVFENLLAVYIRFNPRTNEPAREYTLNLLNENGTSLWFPHPNAKIDIAVIPINFNLLQEHAMQAFYFHSDQHVANIDKLNELGITEGDFAYVLGFPMGLVGGERNAVIVRSGTIARIRDALVRANQEYLIDAFVFPGNSGGPVVSKPKVIAIKGTKSQSASYLIGIVRAYVPYQDVAMSLQTKRPRVIFEENLGLATVHPIDFVQEVIKKHLELSGGTEKSEKT